MKKILLLCVLVAQLAISQVRVNDYAFTSFDGTYTALTGGTVWQTGPTLNVDAYSSEITLPNPFTVGADSYNVIRVYGNGFVTLGKGLNNGYVMDANVKSPISNTVKAWACDYVISGFGTNVVASQFGTPEIRYGQNTSGDFVVQYQDLAVSGFTQTRATCQILLKSDGKTIQVIYGPNNTGQSNVVSPQVGLRGKAILNIQYNYYEFPDWVTRSVPKNSNANVFEANNNWPNNSNGKLSSSTVSWSDGTTVLPTSGRIFQWQPASLSKK